VGALTVDPALRQALTAELDAIREHPLATVGFGEKAYLPYSTTMGQGLVSVPDPEVTTLLGQAIDDAPDPVVALALLHILGQRSDDRVDPVLLHALDSRELSPTAAYLLGRVGYRGYPERARDDAAVIDRLREHLADSGTFRDPFLQRTFRRVDFVVAALVRLLGVQRFTGIDDRQAPLVGLALPGFTDDQVTDLIRQLEAAS
jgi:hypothetical protein